MERTYSKRGRPIKRLNYVEESPEACRIQRIRRSTSLRRTTSGTQSQEKRAEKRKEKTGCANFMSTCVTKPLDVTVFEYGTQNLVPPGNSDVAGPSKESGLAKKRPKILKLDLEQSEKSLLEKNLTQREAENAARTVRRSLNKEFSSRKFNPAPDRCKRALKRMGLAKKRPKILKLDLEQSFLENLKQKEAKNAARTVQKSLNEELSSRNFNSAPDQCKRALNGNGGKSRGNNLNEEEANADDFFDEHPEALKIRTDNGTEQLLILPRLSMCSLSVSSTEGSIDSPGRRYLLYFATPTASEGSDDNDWFHTVRPTSAQKRKHQRVKNQLRKQQLEFKKHLGKKLRNPKRVFSPDQSTKRKRKRLETKKVCNLLRGFNGENLRIKQNMDRKERMRAKDVGLDDSSDSERENYFETVDAEELIETSPHKTDLMYRLRVGLHVDLNV